MQHSTSVHQLPRIAFSWMRIVECSSSAAVHARHGSYSQSSPNVLIIAFLNLSGTCKKHQKQLARCIKRARMAGLLPFMMTVDDITLHDTLKAAPKLDEVTGLEGTDLSSYLQDRLEETEKYVKEGKWDGKELQWDGTVKDLDELEEAEEAAAESETEATMKETAPEAKAKKEEEEEEADVSSEDFVKLMNLLSTHPTKETKETKEPKEVKEPKEPKEPKAAEEPQEQSAK